MKRDRSQQTEKRNGSPESDGSSHAPQRHRNHAVAVSKALGNSAVQELYEEGPLQPRLSVSDPSDRHEREARQVAEQVVDTSSAATDQGNRESLAVHGTGLRSNATIARSVDRTVAAGLQGGDPLPADTRSFFESQFGRDFSDVRVHANASADRAARSIDAQAFTVGNDIAFAHGNYRSGRREGKKLLAHELTHVVQQRHGGSATDRVDRQQGKTTGEKRHPEQRKAEITVDPEPPTVTKMDPTPRDGRGQVIPYPITNDYLIDYYLGMGDPEMQIALYTAAGDYAGERLEEKVKSMIPLQSAQYIKSFLEKQFGDDESKQTPDERFNEIVIENYVERMHWKSREDLVDYHKMRRKVRQSKSNVISRHTPRPEQSVYFKFDSTEFNEHLTPNSHWNSIISEIIDYIGIVHMYKNEIPLVEVEGHSSEVGPEKYNQDLSERRAATVLEKLADDLGDLSSEYLLTSYGVGEGD